MNWRDVWVRYRSELRRAFRERAILVNSVLVPILLYPAMLFITFSLITFASARSERLRVEVELLGEGEARARVEERVRAIEHVTLRAPAGGVRRAREATLQALEAGELEALVEVLPPAEAGRALAGNLGLRITTDSTRDASRAARERLERALSAWRAEWLDRAAADAGLTADRWRVFDLEQENRASAVEMGQFLLGLLLQITFVVMVTAGCFYPAVDATAGERERNTWETTLSLATPRLSVVVAKYLYVATLGALAGFLNVSALTLSLGGALGGAFAQSGVDLQVSVPPRVVPLLLLGAVLIAGFLAAGMMILASFARTFKEGQSMVSVFYLFSVLPLMLLSDQGLSLTPRLACVPLANVALMIRDAFAGSLTATNFALVVATSVLAIVGCVLLAARILRFEDALLGSHAGNVRALIAERLFGRRRKPAGQP